MPSHIRTHGCRVYDGSFYITTAATPSAAESLASYLIDMDARLLASEAAHAEIDERRLALQEGIDAIAVVFNHWYCDTSPAPEQRKVIKTVLADLVPKTEEDLLEELLAKTEAMFELVSCKTDKSYNAVRDYVSARDAYNKAKG